MSEEPTPAGEENTQTAEQILGDVPQAPATPPTPEELAAAAQAQAEGEAIPPVEVTPEVEAANPSNVENAEINPAVAADIAAPATEPEPAPAPNPSEPATPPNPSEPAAPMQNSSQQEWACLDNAGTPTGHVFNSDTHLLGVAPTCPTCGNNTVVQTPVGPQPA